MEKIKLGIVTYEFFPSSKVGAFRMSKLSKYLKKLFNYDISVFTREINNATCDLEETGLSQIYIKHISSRNSVVFLYKIFFNIIKKNVSVIIISGGPFFLFTLVLPLKWVNKKIILDFRDPFYLNPYSIENTVEKVIKQSIRKHIEKIAIKYCNLALFVGQYNHELYKNHYKKYSKKFFVVPNGFDEEDAEILKKQNHFKFMELYKNKKELVILYPGKITSYREKAVELFVEDFIKVSQEKSIKFVHVGTKSRLLEDLFKKYRYNYINLGELSYYDTLCHIDKADICIIFASGNATEETTKIFDYIALKKNIIIYNSNDKSDLIWVLNQHNYPYYTSLMKALDGNTKEKMPNLCEKYSRKKQSTIVHNIIEKALS